MISFFSNGTSYYLLGLILIVLLAFYFNQQPEKLRIIFYIFIASIFIFAPSHMFNQTHWIAISWIHILFFLISIISIYIFGDDFFPKVIYGESRHEVAENGIVAFRASGLFSEPSTLGSHMLFMYVLIEMKGLKKNILATKILILSILATISFASFIMLCILFVRLFKDKKTYKTFLTILFFLVVIFGILFPFFENKIIAYNSLGLENVERFKAIIYIYNYSETWFSGLPSEMLVDLVVYDLGWFFSTFIIFGILGLPVAFAPFLVLPAGASYLLIFLTKLSFTNPICWLLIGQAMHRKKDQKIV
ncbi:MAG: hypothetical protein P8H31_00420 [Porticoccaceae bacterium]|nr:hypothetical protein [Porticoccaceae bacterium]